MKSIPRFPSSFVSGGMLAIAALVLVTLSAHAQGGAGGGVALEFGGGDLVSATQNLGGLSGGSVAFNDQTPVSPATGYAGPAFYGAAFAKSGAVIDQWNFFNDNTNGDSLRFRMVSPPVNAASVGLFLWKREDFASPYNVSAAVNLTTADAFLAFSGRRFGTAVGGDLRFVVQAADGAYYVSSTQGPVPVNFATVTLADPLVAAEWYAYAPPTDTIGATSVIPDFSSILAAGARLEVVKLGADGGAITAALTGFSIGAGSNVPVVVNGGDVFALAGEPFSLAVSATNSPTQFVFGPLPSGLIADAATGTISGTPTSPGYFSTTVQAANASGAGPETALEFSIAVPSEAAIPHEGLVANYEFTGNANDLAGNRGGRIHGAALTADRFGRPGSAFLFDGMDDFIEVADDDDYSLSTTGEFAMSVWIRPATLNFPVFDSTGYVHYLGKGEPGNHEWTFRMYNEVTTDSPPRPNRTSFYVFDIDGGKGNGTYVQEPVTAGEWIHFVAVMKIGAADDYPTSNYIKWYKNGTLVDTKPIDGSPFPGIVPANGAAPMRIGTRNLTSYFQGAIDDLRIYRRVLSPIEVQFLHVEDPASTGANLPPTDVILSQDSLELSAAFAGATVGTLSATDPDAADTHVYALVAGAGSTDNDAFTLAGDVLSVGPSALGAGNHDVRIRATDAGGLFFEKAFTIAVIDTTPLPPAVVTQPQSQAAVEGSTVTFTAGVTGYPEPSRQWRKDGGDLPGADGAALTLVDVTAAAAGDYTLVAVNTHGVATSEVARLIVYAPSAQAVAFGGVSLVTANQNMARLAGGAVPFSEASPVTPGAGYAGRPVYGGAFVANGGVLDQWNVFNDNVNGDSLRFRMVTPPLQASSAGLFLWQRADFAAPHDGDANVNLAAPDAVLQYTGRRFGSEIGSEVRFVVQVADGGYYISEPQGDGIPANFGTVTLIDPVTAQWFAYSPSGDAIAPVATTPNLTSILSAGVRLKVTKTGGGGGNITIALSGFSVVAGTEKIAPTLIWPEPAAIGYGTPLSAAQLNATAVGFGGATIEGVFDYTPTNGAVLAAGANQALNVTFTPTGVDADIYESAVAAATLTVLPAATTVVLSDLNQPYDGTPRVVEVLTTPDGLPVSVTYDGGAEPPIYPGSYAVAATIESSNYTGATSGTLVVTTTAVVRHAPTVNGGLDGSLQVLLPENVTLNGSAWISGDLLVPGTPTLQLNGQPLHAGVIDGPGSLVPASHRVTLNGGAVLRYLVRRIDASAMPVVAAPPAPSGNRNIVLNAPGDSAGDFTTLRNLTLNGNAGAVAVPPGTYGAFLANGSSGFTLGVAGASEPAVYNFQTLTLNGGAFIHVAGPVIVVLGQRAVFNGPAGAEAHPEWLTLHIATGGLTLNSGSTVHANVVAPAGTVMINGSAELNGRVVADRLTINGAGRLSEPSP